jgi:hypothetical protein
VWNSKRAGKANWYGQLVALAQCRLGGGRMVDAVLVRWYEAAPMAVDAAVAAVCMRLRFIGWCPAASVRRREAVVVD